MCHVCLVDVHYRILHAASYIAYATVGISVVRARNDSVGAFICLFVNNSQNGYANSEKMKQKQPFSHSATVTQSFLDF